MRSFLSKLTARPATPNHIKCGFVAFMHITRRNYLKKLMSIRLKRSRSSSDDWKKGKQKILSYSFDCRDEPAMHNMQNISK